MKLCKIFIIIFLSIIFMLGGCKRKAAEVPVIEQTDSVPPIGFWADSLDMFEGTVRNGETLTTLLTRLGMDADSAYSLAMKCDTVFDVRKMRAGNRYRAYYFMDSTAIGSTAEHPLEYVVYDHDKVNMTIFKCNDSLAVWNFSKPVETEDVYTDVTICTSLWNDMAKAGASVNLIAALSDIYAWTVDFFGLQEGDRFRVLYEQESCEGEIIDVHRIYYAEFQRDSSVLPAIYFDQGDDGNLYWNEKGESMRKAFLKAPLKFTRISSGFSYHRRHPVTGQVKAHTAVDYAAPTGTPVMSIGDGTVVSAGWSGGGGNTVKIRHNSVYQTAYLHLSRYATGIKAGARVHQGDVIGYVGSTGMSTGPHLDFRVWKNGSPVNPLKLESPPSDPIKEENRVALDSVRLGFRQEMDSLARK
ncbi:MAG: peptidoglycan DD-metalloendopeptidase family protein [Bacteroidales bacterium]|nr:peptidoglycan DD-metalloendopeptidase family protein [Bacteroidales bacterium]MDY6000841.1 peptidoglycan DD-metalloendopeptidase family protein [Candidatus Cryptobacteroides sp.]